MEINLTDINAKTKNFYNLKTVEKSTADYEGGEFYEIKDLGGDVYLKIYQYIDSYGTNEITGFEFVQAKEQTITNYETI